jgi:4a-hydroxytetrahydrobiopterin dehydratase
MTYQRPALLTEAELAEQLPLIPEWGHEGNTIRRVFTFENFKLAMAFVNAVADIAEEADHHPDFLIVWNKVTLTFSTHDSGGLTHKDIAGARRVNALAG